MWRINQRVNKLGQSLRRIIYSPNWSISLCGCQDTCGPALWCGEHVQAPAENPLAPERGTAWSLNLRCRGGVEHALLCVSENMYFWWLQVCGENVQAPFFFVSTSEVFFFVWLYDLPREAKQPGCSRSHCASSLSIALVAPAPLSVWLQFN